jgi:acetyl esterase/lipase
MKHPRLFLMWSLLIASTFALNAQQEIFLWKDSITINDPAKYPTKGYSEERFIDAKRNVLVIRKVTNPSIRVFLADKKLNTGAAILICPGGGMNAIEIEHEGTAIAKEFVKLGINSIVLKYRHYNMDVAMTDAKQALNLIRTNAQKWGINEKTIGMGGFSAGGRLSLVTAYNLINNDTLDCNKGISFLLFVYTRTQVLEGAQVNKCFPPSFMVVTADDFRYTMNLEFFSILQKNKVPSELHIFQQGLHGFGLGKGLCNCDKWPILFYNWLKNNNILKQN